MHSISARDGAAAVWAIESLTEAEASAELVSCLRIRRKGGILGTDRAFVGYSSAWDATERGS